MAARKPIIITSSFWLKPGSEDFQSYEGILRAQGQEGSAWLLEQLLCMTVEQLLSQSEGAQLPMRRGRTWETAAGVHTECCLGSCDTHLFSYSAAQRWDSPIANACLDPSEILICFHHTLFNIPSPPSSSYHQLS